MALFHVSHPPWLRPVGIRTSYIHFSNISWTPRVLDPITNPFLGPSSWLHPASKLFHNLISCRIKPGDKIPYDSNLHSAKITVFNPAHHLKILLKKRELYSSCCHWHELLLRGSIDFPFRVDSAI